jgi:xanthine dehydrogenase YagR molybdenum-binding subunit
MLHAMLAIATISRGKIEKIDTQAARAVPGVRLVLTHEDLGDLKSASFLFHEGYAFQSLRPMMSPAIAYRNQPIALVAADTLEAAIEGGARDEASYAVAPFNVTFDAPPADIIAQTDSPLPRAIFGDRIVGDADKAFADAAIKIDSSFTAPPQHQNPMELVGICRRCSRPSRRARSSGRSSWSCRACRFSTTPASARPAGIASA